MAPDCDLVVCADLNTRLPLRHLSDQALPREGLDRLTTQAADAFMLVDETGAEADTVILFGSSDIQICTRSGEDKSDLLFATAYGPKDLVGLSDLAAETARQISEANT